MKSIGIAGLVVVVAGLASSAASTSSAFAAVYPCWKIAVEGQGLYKDQRCTSRGAGGAGELKAVRGRIAAFEEATSEACVATELAKEGNYETLLKCENKSTAGRLTGTYARVKFAVKCIKVAVAGTGSYEDADCKNVMAGGNYIKVVVPLSLPRRPAGGVACLHVAKAGTGTYKTEEGCDGETKESEGTEGEYIKVDYPNQFTSAGRASTLKAGGESVSCTEENDTGEIASSDAVSNVSLYFNGCRSSGSGGSNCTVKSTNSSTGGEIITNELMGAFGTVKASEASSGEGLLLLPESGKQLTVLASNSCTIETAVTGQIVGEASPVGISQTTGKLAFAVTSGKQNIKDIHTLAGLVAPALDAFATSATDEGSDELTYEEAFSIP
jgi:hypothetical protein